MLQSGVGNARPRLGSPRHGNAAWPGVAHRRHARHRRLSGLRLEAGARDGGGARARHSLGLAHLSGPTRPFMSPRRTTSQSRVLDNLRVASRKGDRTALALALDEMRTLAFTPRYWLRYLTLIRHPLARIVDLLVIKQGEKIARQKG